MPLESRSTIEERAKAAIDFPAEFPGIEFKANLGFETINYRIAKTSMAMSNLRDGGLIIVGVAQDAMRNFVVEGVSNDNTLTYIQETVYEFVNKYASPPVELRVMTVHHRSKDFTVIAVPPFERTPVVCRRNTPDGTSRADQMREGDCFVRTGSPVATQRVKSAEMMADLLEIAVVRRIAEQDRIRREAGVSSFPVQESRFDNEVSDVADAL